jgi:hypothetical protein
MSQLVALAVFFFFFVQPELAKNLKLATLYSTS